jgi:hypothetical protein
VFEARGRAVAAPAMIMLIQRLLRRGRAAVIALALAGAALVAAGCGGDALPLVVVTGGKPALRPLDAAESSGDLAYRAPFPAYETASPGGRGRVFLVALSADTANFAQEVVDQRRDWLRAGFRPDQVVCYYVKPTRANYRRDRQQFDALSAELVGFYPAAPSLIRRHLRDAAAEQPDAIYLYLTSHGSPPMSHETGPRELKLPAARYVLEHHPQLDDHWLSTDATETGTMDLLMKFHAADRGADPGDLFLTPAVLRDWLAAFPASTRKTVVLQGCYSGGFLTRDPDYPSADSATLADVPNLVAIAAARYDRSSFGCAPGDDRTIFGGSWLDELRERLATGRDVDWAALYANVKAAVDRAEATMNYPIAERSRPVMITTPPTGGPSAGE